VVDVAIEVAVEATVDVAVEVAVEVAVAEGIPVPGFVSDAKGSSSRAARLQALL